MFKKIISAALSVALSVTVLCGCENNKTEDTPLTLDKKSYVVVVGNTFDITASVPVTWTVSSEQKLKTEKVEKDSISLTGLSTGNAVVEARDNVGRTAKCQVTIVKTRVEITNVTGNELTLDLSEPEKALEVNVRYSDDMSVTYSTDYYAVAEVSQSGVIKAKKPGVANITVKHASGAFSTVKVTVVGDYTVPTVPLTWTCGSFVGGHVQCIAMDSERKYIYYTFV
ncbi:MAG: Ig-like domain-containing protein, partial [Clostridia bacterium]|nr:Ig-like domain-containing protein [Clostridia bacterium]